MFYRCNSAHNDEFCILVFAHLYFTGVSWKHVDILSDRDIRGQLEPWRLILAMIFNYFILFYSGASVGLVLAWIPSASIHMTKIVVTSSQFHFPYKI